MVGVLGWLVGSCGGGGGGGPTGPGGPVVASVTIEPREAVLVPSQTLQLEATARDAAGSPIEGVSISWSSEAEDVAVVSPAGLVTALAGGRAVVTARAGSATGAATIEVQQGGTVGAGGGQILAGGGRIHLSIPPGAVPDGTTFTVLPDDDLPDPPEGFWAVASTAYAVELDGALAAPVRVTIAFEESDLPPWAMDGDLGILRWDGSDWEPLEEIVVDVGAGTVSGVTDRFSSVVVSAEFPEISLTPDPASVNANQRSVILNAIVTPRGDHVFDESFGAYRYRWSATTVNGTASHDGASDDAFGELTEADAVQYIATIPVIPEGELDRVTVEVIWIPFDTSEIVRLGTATTTIKGDLKLTVHLAPSNAGVPLGGSVSMRAVIQGPPMTPPPGFDRVFDWGGTQIHGTLAPAPGTRTAQETITYAANSASAADPPRVDRVTVTVQRVDRVASRDGWDPENILTRLVYTEVGSAEAFVTVGDVQYQVSVSPASTSVEAGGSAAFEANLDPPYQGEGSPSYRWTTTGDFGSLSGSDSRQVTYNANVGPPGTDVVEVEVLDGAGDPIGAASATVNVEGGQVETSARLEVETYPNPAALGPGCQVRPYFEWDHVEGVDHYQLMYLDDAKPKNLIGNHDPVVESVAGNVLRTGDHFRTLAGFGASDPAKCPDAVELYERRFTELKAIAVF